MTDETTTITVSDALKSHLHQIKQDYGEYAVDGVSTLYDSLEYLLDNQYDTEISIDGYEETLDKPIKVPKPLLDRVKAEKEMLNARDYEETIRTRANIEQRDIGERPIQTGELPD
jgi:hypothetical protein